MKTWAAEALNTAPDSKNEIHGDKLAKEFGFKDHDGAKRLYKNALNLI